MKKHHRISDKRYIPHNRSHLLPVRFLLGALLVGCAGKREVTIVGERRDPMNDCQKSFVEYHFKVKEQETIPDGIPPDWCALMDGTSGLTCIVEGNNVKEWPYINRPRTLPHTEPDDDHPDWICWEEERRAWYGEDTQPSDGGASGQPMDTD